MDFDYAVPALAVAALLTVAELLRAARVRAHMAALAARFAGTVEIGPDGRPQVRFCHRGREVLVGERGGPVWPVPRRLEFRIPVGRADEPAFRIRRRGSPSRRLLRARPLSGDPAFDRRFRAVGDPHRVAGLFPVPVREALARVELLCGGYGLAADFADGRLTLRVGAGAAARDDLFNLTEAALALADAVDAAIRDLTPAGTLVIADGGPGGADPKCPVCGEPTTAARTVRCPGCGIPHHADCWSFQGGCSVFGCRGGRSG